MATLTLQQPNANQFFFNYSSYYYSYIDKTAKGWYVSDDATGAIYGAFYGTGITYDTNGNPILGTITSVSSLDATGAIKWTISQPGIAANSTSSIRSVLATSNPFSDYMTGTVLKDNDTIVGSSGNDIIYYSDGSDTINGGAGEDWMTFAENSYYNNSLNVNLATGKYTINNGGTIISSHISNVENIIGSPSADSLTGNAANNIFIGGNGNDTIDGGAGIDTVSYAQMFGVSADLTTGIATENYYKNYPAYTYSDSLTSIENLIGTSYNDTLTGNAGNNVLTGGAGDDTLDGRLGVDTADFSTAYKGVTANLATSSSTGHGTDILNNIENINGSTYGDTLIGNAGSNTLNGNAGNDTLNGGKGDDVLIGGLGIDQANYINATTAVTVNLGLATAQNTQEAGNDKLSGIENLLGTKFNDVLTGDGLANTLNGGLGDDKLNGASGNDVLIGGTGKDNMTGGLGSDSFVFNEVGDTGLGANKDVIAGFVHGTDKINLSAVDANAFVNGNQAFTLISSAAAFTAAGQIKFNAGILSGDVTGEGTADFQIALTGVTTLTAGDFLL